MLYGSSSRTLNSSYVTAGVIWSLAGTAVTVTPPIIRETSKAEKNSVDKPLAVFQTLLIWSTVRNAAASIFISTTDYRLY